jgi:hypothetical protein
MTAPDPRLPVSPPREWPRPYRRADAASDRWACPRSGELSPCETCGGLAPHRFERLARDGALLACERHGLFLVERPNATDWIDSDGGESDGRWIGPGCLGAAGGGAGSATEPEVAPR